MKNNITYEIVVGAVIDGDMPPTKKLYLGNTTLLKFVDSIIFNLGQYIYTHCFVGNSPFPDRSTVNQRVSYMLNYMPISQNRRYGMHMQRGNARNYMLEAIAVAIQFSKIYQNKRVKSLYIDTIMHDAHYSFYNILNWAYLQDGTYDRVCPNELRGLKYINENLNKLPKQLSDVLKNYWINRVKSKAIPAELQEMQDSKRFFYKPPIVKLNTVSQYVKSALRQPVIV